MLSNTPTLFSIKSGVTTKTCHLRGCMPASPAELLQDGSTQHEHSAGTAAHARGSHGDPKPASRGGAPADTRSPSPRSTACAQTGCVAIGVHGISEGHGSEQAPPMRACSDDEAAAVAHRQHGDSACRPERPGLYSDSGGAVGEGMICEPGSNMHNAVSSAAGPEAVSVADDGGRGHGGCIDAGDKGEDGESGKQAGGVPGGAPGEAEGLGRVQRRLRRVGRLILQSLLNPPTVAIAIGVFVAVVTPLRNVFFTEEDDSDGGAVVCGGPGNETEAGAVVVEGTGGEGRDSAELEVITKALTRLGGAMVPSLLLNLGAALYNGPGGTGVPALAIGALMVIRLVALPVLGTLCVLGGRAARLWSVDDPMFELVMLMQHAMPSALNLYTLAALHGNHDKVIATMLFWQYMLCVLTIPACVTVFLALVR